MTRRGHAGDRRSEMRLVEAKSVADTLNFHCEIERVDARRVGDVLRVDVSVTQGQWSQRFMRRGDDLAGSLGVEVLAETSPLDQFGGGGRRLRSSRARLRSSHVMT